MGRKLFAEILTKARQHAGLSRVDVAAASGLSVRGLVKWERGERLPGSEELAKLCRAIKASCATLHAAILAEDPAGGIPEGKSGRPKKLPTPTDPPDSEPAKKSRPKKK